MARMKIDLERIHLLSEEINIPDEIIGQISKIIADNDFSDIEGYFNMFFSLKTADEAYKKIISKLKENEYSLKPLAVYLAAALKTWELYEKSGIPRQIYIETMKMFSRYLREHLETYGFYGFDRDFWTYRILAASLFRLGALEFEMIHYPNNDMLKSYAAEGEKIISVHIPSDAIMTRENLNQSYKMASSFFEKYFPEYKDRIMFCRTWLLDPVLKNLLPKKSKILEFQSDYKIMETSNEDSNFMVWVYKKKIDDYSLLPENTTLQKNMKKFLLSGGNISLTTGIKI
jgi:hypothetical protein